MEIKKPPSDGQSMYRIEVKGILDQKWSEWFDGFTITYSGKTNTLLTGKVRDQSALHGILANIRDLGLILVSITESEEVPGKCDHPKEGPSQ